MATLKNKDKKKTPAEELVALAQVIREWQIGKGYSIAALLRKYAGLGSDRTYNRLVTGDTSDLNVEKQLLNYQTVWSLIEAVGDKDRDREEFYDDFSSAVQLRRAAMEVFVETGINRFLLVQGDTGSGKTTAALLLQKRYGAHRVRRIELSPWLNDSPLAFLVMIIEAFGQEAPHGSQQCWKKAVELLGAGRCCLVFDELHHAGPRVLNTIKSLINATPGEFIGLTMKTLWYRLEKKSYEEVRQLTGNRLAERIQLDRMNQSDLVKYLSRRLPKLEKGADFGAATMLAENSRGKGNMAFARAVCRAAVERYEDKPITIQDFAAVVASERQRR